MQSNLTKSLERIFTSFSSLNPLTKDVIKYGVQVFFGLFILGTILVVFNHTYRGFSLYHEFIATSIIKSSFIVLAEVIIGGLVIDFVFKKT